MRGRFCQNFLRRRRIVSLNFCGDVAIGTVDLQRAFEHTILWLAIFQTRWLCQILEMRLVGDWSVHFIGSDGKTRIGPWLLLDSHEEVRAILRWGNITEEELAEHERASEDGVCLPLFSISPTGSSQRSSNEAAAGHGTATSCV